jgi:putative transposase
MVDATQTPAELEAVRTSVLRGRPFGDAAWTRSLADRFSLGSTLRPPGRPRHEATTPDGGEKES